MKKMICTGTLLLVSALATTALADSKGPIDGKVEFEKHCAVCHPNGGNIIKPKETLKGIKSTKKVIAKMRKGGGGMTVFSKQVISDPEAKAIAEYVVTSFKK